MPPLPLHAPHVAPLPLHVPHVAPLPLHSSHVPPPAPACPACSTPLPLHTPHVVPLPLHVAPLHAPHAPKAVQPCQTLTRRPLPVASVGPKTLCNACGVRYGRASKRAASVGAGRSTPQLQKKVGPGLIDADGGLGQ